MLCKRCGGLLIENWWDPNNCVQPKRLLSTRCVNCGCIDDPVIRANRRHPHRARMTLTRGNVNHAKFSRLSGMKEIPTQVFEHGDSITP